MEKLKNIRLSLPMLLVLCALIFTSGSAEAAKLPGPNEVVVSINSPSKLKLPVTHLKILVWNLHKGADETFSPEYLSLAQESDISLNQEIFLDKKMQEVFAQLPNFLFTTATSFYSGSGKIRTGVATASTVSPIFTKFIKTKNAEPFLGTPKMSLITTYPLENSQKQLTIVNIHAINFVTSETFHAELEQIYQEIKNFPPPLIFAGDFNSWSEERLRILDGYRKRLNLTEAVFFPDHRMTFSGNPLDHFYYSSDIQVTSARVEANYSGSDHQPLQLELDIIPE